MIPDGWMDVDRRGAEQPRSRFLSAPSGYGTVSGWECWDPAGGGRIAGAAEGQGVGRGLQRCVLSPRWRGLPQGSVPAKIHDF